MNVVLQHKTISWPLWRKIVFRFFFIYLLLLIAPWTWLDAIPGISYVTQYYYRLMDWAVNTSNEKLFHVREVLVPINGSGDTSYGWTQVWLFLCIAIAGCIIWSAIDRKRLNYRTLNYGLCVFTRYYVAMIAFSYGIIKLFALQMPFPGLSQLATPLGDFLPMRLSWMFIGYSAPYQFFAGALEVMVGVLLLYRRTATLGIILATAVFSNVMVLNLSYDIPVKIFSIQIVLMCLFLLANEYDRIVCFFFLNKPASPCNTYHFSFHKKWMRITRIILKTAFIIIAVGMTFYQSWNWYDEVNNQSEIKPVKAGVYNVAVFAINKDTMPALITDTLRWQDVIFEKGGFGSIKTSDTMFRQRYTRGYFFYAVDTLQKNLNFKKSSADSSFILSMRYEMPDSNTIQLWGRQKNDSLYVLLKRSNRHFQLAEKQFHWLSEYNR